MPQSSYKDLRESNILGNRYITIVLSETLLKNPIPLRCMFCGEYLNIALHKEPKAFIDTQYKIEDCDPAIDVRCKRCKVNYRIAY